MPNQMTIIAHSAGSPMKITCVPYTVDKTQLELDSKILLTLNYILQHFAMYSTITKQLKNHLLLESLIG